MTLTDDYQIKIASRNHFERLRLFLEGIGFEWVEEYCFPVITPVKSVSIWKEFSMDYYLHEGVESDKTLLNMDWLMFPDINIEIGPDKKLVDMDLEKSIMAFNILHDHPENYIFPEPLLIPFNNFKHLTNIRDGLKAIGCDFKFDIASYPFGFLDINCQGEVYYRSVEFYGNQDFIRVNLDWLDPYISIQIGDEKFLVSKNTKNTIIKYLKGEGKL